MRRASALVVAFAACAAASLSGLAGDASAQTPPRQPAQPPTPAPSPAPPALPIFTLPGGIPLPAPPLAVNPVVPAPQPGVPFAPVWPAQIQLPSGFTVQVPPLPAAPYWSRSGVLVLPHPADLANLGVLANIVAQNLAGRRCGLREMAPGVYVRLDCHPRQPVAASRDVFSPEKLKMLANGQLHMAKNRPAPAPTQTEQPESVVDHRTEGLEGPVKDQGAVGDCTAFSLSTAIDNAILRLHKNEVSSPLHIWSRYGYPELGQGTRANMGKPIASLAVLPYSPRQACELDKDPEEDCGQAYGVRTNSAALDPVLQAQLARAESAGTFRLAGVDQITSRPVNTDAIAAVLSTGADVIVGMDIDSRAWKVTRDSAVVPDYTQTDGGHAMVLAGYRKTSQGRQFLVHNSWGGTWGDHGFAWVSEAMVQKNTQYAFKVRVTDPGGAEPVSHTDDECDPNQLIDYLTGKCNLMCPGLKRSAGGKC